MSITARDRKILLILLPVIVLGVYWFLILSPKRAEVSKANEDVAAQQAELDAAQQQLTQLKSIRGNFETEFASVVRLGKAIPSNVDMPSLLVQLDSAAKGTGIKFERITAGARSAAPAAAPAAGGTQPPDTANGNAAPGGTPASSGPGKAAETAGNAVNTQNGASEKSGQLDTTTSQSTKQGGLPVGGGGTPGGAPADGTSGVAGLDTVPLELDFSGSYFDLSNFLHRMKRFVKVNNQHIKVSGRLITIDGMDLKLSGFGGRLTATLKATVYLVPKAQGVAAGATPAGPGATPAAAGGQSTPAEAPASGGAPVNPPEAVVTP